MHRSTIQLLRFHFSFFLLPVYLFAISQAPNVNWLHAIIAFVILHLLVYPASNGYNSYMDRDETPIGGLEKPLQPTKQLFFVTVVMDILAVSLSVLLLNVRFAVCILFYILASRAYSYRKIRLKRYPVVGFLTVFVFQGAVVFYAVYTACVGAVSQAIPILPCWIASLLIGALYPLTQIYQHDADLKDGVVTLSYLLGKRGTFIFSALLFIIATISLFILFRQQEQLAKFYLYLLVTLPVVLFFCYWMVRVWINNTAANFRNSLLMNLVSTLCTIIFFSTLIYTNHIEQDRFNRHGSTSILPPAK
ncbi:UbiA family prenyltransferase [Chitinophagaceae bacterium LB-8]|uniref:UbiA family prenyltransferase n=1 Tax=Paraflavisolibacter caeni TaxID=2982496 RepID=A0A9X2XUM4_9BACT|nr:UbiA family prenyltransferase [Paraflavisolibacter caeni]MCU7548043.1 UbiA family prenyltransferase [Paraflavisolibacter caeni]